MSDTSNNPDATTPESPTPDASGTTADEMESDETAETPLPLAGHIRNVGMLDLRSAKTPEDLNGITAISKVGCILAPKDLATRLAQIPMAEVGAVIPIPSGENIKCPIGQIWLTGQARVRRRTKFDYE
jgi:hypothetical protein